MRRHPFRKALFPGGTYQDLVRTGNILDDNGDYFALRVAVAVAASPTWSERT